MLLPSVPLKVNLDLLRSPLTTSAQPLTTHLLSHSSRDLLKFPEGEASLFSLTLHLVHNLILKHVKFYPSLWTLRLSKLKNQELTLVFSFISAMSSLLWGNTKSTYLDQLEEESKETLGVKAHHEALKIWFHNNLYIHGERKKGIQVQRSAFIICYFKTMETNRDHLV